jgi:hypothetical protein
MQKNLIKNLLTNIKFISQKSKSFATKPNPPKYTAKAEMNESRGVDRFFD